LGAEQKEAFEKIKEYMSTPPVLRPLKLGEGFKIYITAQEHVIGAVLLQEEGQKEFPIAYVSRRLLNMETRYAFVEKLCLSLYYACSKFRHYILSSTCTVVWQYNVIKHMMSKPILSGRLGKWAYSLVEYDLVFEPLQAMRGQVVADFLVDHGVRFDQEIYVIDILPWKLYFEGSVCSERCVIGCVIVSPHGITESLSSRLEFECTNNQAEYEALWFGLEYLVEMGVRNIDAFGDSMLVVQQVKGKS
jgi:hypothetical protein